MATLTEELERKALELSDLRLELQESLQATDRERFTKEAYTYGKETCPNTYGKETGPNH